jgi:hypothetical protein
MKRPSDKTLTNKLDQLIRDILKATYQEPVECFICKKKYPWFHPRKNPYGIQVGHYISRTVFALRWDLKNVFPSCSSCNRIHEENTLPYTKAILDTFGQERINYLNDKWQASKKKAKTFTRGEKLELAESLKFHLEKLQTE